MPHFKFSHFSLPLAAPAPGFEAALVARLQQNTLLTNLVGTRIFPLRTPQNVPRTGARLLYAITGNERPRNLAGATGIATARVHFDLRSPNYADCKTGQELLRQYDGMMGNLAGSITILFAQLETHGDEFEWPSDGSDAGMQHLSVTYYFKYREPRPIVP